MLAVKLVAPLVIHPAPLVITPHQLAVKLARLTLTHPRPSPPHPRPNSSLSPGALPHPNYHARSVSTVNKELHSPQLRVGARRVH